MRGISAWHAVILGSSLSTCMAMQGLAEELPGPLQECMGLYREGYALAQHHNCPAAIEKFQAVVGQCPQLPAAHHSLGLCYSLAGDLNKAIQAMSEAAKLAPHIDAYLHGLALEYMNQRDWEHAVELVDSAWKRQGSLGFELAVALISARTSSLTEVQQVRDILFTVSSSKRFPDQETRELWQQGVNLLERERVEEAIAKFTELSKRYPQDPLTFFSLAQAHQRLGDQTAALAAIE